MIIVLLVIITGILARLDYLKDVGSKVLYINSMYESNDQDHKAIVNHTKIDEIYGSIEDFVELRKVTKKMKSMYIMQCASFKTKILYCYYLFSLCNMSQYFIVR